MDMNQWLRDEVKKHIKEVEYRDIPEDVGRYLKTDYSFNHELNDLIYSRENEKYFRTISVKVFNKKDGFLIECRGMTSDGKWHSVKDHLKHVNAADKGMAFEYAKRTADRHFYEMSGAITSVDMVCAENAAALVGRVYHGSLPYMKEKALVYRLRRGVMEELKAFVESLSCDIFIMDCLIRDHVASVWNELDKGFQNGEPLIY